MNPNDDIHSLNLLFLQTIANSSCDNAELATLLGTTPDVIALFKTINASWLKLLSEANYAWFSLQGNNDVLWSDLYIPRLPEETQPYPNGVDKSFSQFLLLALPYAQHIARQKASMAKVLFGFSDYSQNVLSKISPAQLYKIGTGFPGLVQVRFGQNLIWNDIEEAISARSKPQLKNSLTHAVTLMLNS